LSNFLKEKAEVQHDFKIYFEPVGASTISVLKGEILFFFPALAFAVRRSGGKIK